MSKAKKSKAEEYKKKLNEFVKNNFKASETFDNILNRMHLQLDASESKSNEELVEEERKRITNILYKEVIEYNNTENIIEEEKIKTCVKFFRAKLDADKKLKNQINIKEIDTKEIDKKLSQLIETCHAHASLKSGVAEYKLEGKLEVFNYSGNPKNTPTASVIMRDARLQDSLQGVKGVLFEQAHVVDTYIANMAGVARGAIALIEKSDMAPINKENAKKQCIKLLYEHSEQLIKNRAKKTKNKDFAKSSVKEVEKFNDQILQNLKVYKKAKLLTIDRITFTSEKKLINALSEARTCAMMNTYEDHCHVVTIHRTIGNRGKEKNGFSFSAIGDPIPQDLRNDYNNIKKNKEGENVELPQWYKDKTLIEQKMIYDNIDNYLSGRCILSSQDRTVAGVVNYYTQLEGIVTHDGKIDKNRNIMLQRGTFGDRQTKHTYKKNVKACLEHLSGVAKNVTFQNVASNSIVGGLTTKKKENILHASMKDAVEELNQPNNVTYDQNGFNTLSAVTSIFSGGRAKAMENIIQSVGSVNNNDQTVGYNESADERVSYVGDNTTAEENKIEDDEIVSYVEGNTTAEEEEPVVSINCMSSKDRTSGVIDVLATELIGNNLIDKGDDFDEYQDFDEILDETIEANDFIALAEYAIIEKSGKTIETTEYSNFENKIKELKNLKQELENDLEEYKNSTEQFTIIEKPNSLNAQNLKEEYAKARISSGCNATLACRQGGTPGVFALKLLDSLKMLIGLGVTGSILKESVKQNQALAGLNKLKFTSKGIGEKVKNFLGVGEKYKEQLDLVKEAQRIQKEYEEEQRALLNIKNFAERVISEENNEIAPGTTPINTNQKITALIKQN